mgnify:CR=1 FL=1
MSKNYHQLSQEQRYQIEALICNGASQKEIAMIIGKSPSTISRALKRNFPKRGRGALVCSAWIAQGKTTQRHKNKFKHVRFDDEQKELTRNWLSELKLSPEFIHVEGKKLTSDFVSHETIYKWIWRCKQSHRQEDIQDRNLYKHLAHGKRRRKRGLRRDSRGVIHVNIIL